MTTGLAVNISLEYYQLLNVPRTAPLEQIQQAYSDRQRQQPRAEFSAPVLSARQELIHQAYATLSDGEARARYDETLTQTGASLTLEDQQSVAGLLLLLEAGAFQTVLEYSPQVQQTPDGTLVTALALREYGAQLLQQGKVALAVAQIQAAQELITPSKRFTNLERELQERLRQARPYLILELLELEEAGGRSLAIQQFEQMLEERKGIEGDGQDGSNLNRDQLFQFIQELLPLLNADEQRAIFAREAERPSMGASYLVSQVLIAQGLALAEPSLIRQARGYLIRLAQRRDVSLELAVCALLLGQVEAAEQALARSTDMAALASIQRLSTGAPDQLPGLCQYAQDWITGQLFSQTRDLKDQGVTLHNYFAQPQVQQSLEAQAADSSQDAPAVSPDLSDLPLPTPALRRRGLVPGLLLVGLAGGLAAFWYTRVTSPTLPIVSQRAPVPQVLPAVPPPANPVRSEAPAPATTTPRPTPSVPSVPAPAKLDAATATVVIQNWQRVKQQALGIHHDISGLAQVLSKAQHQQWAGRAQAMARAGHHWRYTLEEVRVTRVEPLDQAQGTVTVRLQEAAQFYEGDQLNRQRSYRKSYTVRYTLQRTPVGWVIADITL
ncbi:IMS domain-containing protein [Anthocerotibacter panamensis]|uniref:IMS domain-containing protein n=1 Tax=Anthocerotibacter panamensis TaxID=2857077 RepID=UPI001C402FD2|nr:IMS domain-containing protein [Anthocerotibacter panamensis]